MKLLGQGLTFDANYVPVLFVFDTPSPSELAPTDTAEERRAWRLQVLEELTGFSLNLARALSARAIEQAAAEPEDTGPEQALARVSRSVRLSLALHARFDEDRRARMPEPKAEVRPEIPGVTVPPTYAEIMRRRGLARRRMIRDRVACLIENEAREKGDGYEAERLLGELHVKLVEVEDITEFASPPVAEMVFNMCRDLGVRFDERVFVDKDWWTLPPAGGPWANPFAPAPGVNRERWSPPPDPGDDCPP